MDRLTNKFNRSEFTCGCGCSRNDINLEFVSRLQAARTLADIPFEISSGVRCEEHNKAVGGKTDSSHLKGVAADIECTQSRDRYLLLGSLITCGFNRIGIGKNFIHVDADNDKPPNVVWHYYNS